MCVSSVIYVNVIILLILNQNANAVDTKNSASEFSKHRLVQPTVYHGETKREISTTKHNGTHHPVVTVALNIDDETYMLDLNLNTNLVPGDHVISYQKSGETVLHKPTLEELDLCQYIGTIRGKPGSWAAVSTCQGLRGILYDGHQMKYIEPAQVLGNEISSNHFIYDHSDLNMDFHQGYQGGMKSREDQLGFEKSRISRYKRQTASNAHIRGPFGINRLSRYVELVLVADRSTYKANGENLNSVHRQLKDVANIMNSLYAPLNIFIALVGVVVWTERDEIELKDNGDITLRNFLQYRRNNLTFDIPNDNAQLLTSFKFSGDVFGKAIKGVICTHEYSGGVASNYSEVIGLVATTVAHMIGHNFGMDHDGSECECPDERCIMSPMSSSTAPTHWSSCSLQSLALSFKMGLDYCLRNKPERLFDSPTCGNGFLEPGEECDCGLQPSAQCSACCQVTLCLLQPDASCAVGECCDPGTCRPRSVGTMCRAAVRECDLPEFCSGISEFCPRDIYKMDATPCSNNQAYCVRGSCRTHTDQCQLLWGPTGQNSDRICYNKAKKFGNCSYNFRTSEYESCQPEDLLCGRLQCRHLNDRLEFGSESTAILAAVFIQSNGTIHACHTAIIDLGLNDVDPGLVPDGAKCGEGMDTATVIQASTHRCAPMDLEYNDSEPIALKLNLTNTTGGQTNYEITAVVSHDSGPTIPILNLTDTTERQIEHEITTVESYDSEPGALINTDKKRKMEHEITTVPSHDSEPAVPIVNHINTTEGQTEHKIAVSHDSEPAAPIVNLTNTTEGQTEHEITMTESYNSGPAVTIHRVFNLWYTILRSLILRKLQCYDSC